MALALSQIKNVERQVVVAVQPGEEPPLLPTKEQEASLDRDARLSDHLQLSSC